jgi:hypothetical protein
MEILSERLAYWFLRLNGFVTTTNFLVHPDEGRRGQHTEVDVMAVRFPHRKENRARPMQDDARLVDEERIQVLLAEAKLTKSRFNQSWLDPKRGNLQRILAALGVFEAKLLEHVCDGLYKSGEWTDGKYWVRLAAFAERHNRTLANGPWDGVPQFQWKEHVLPFIHERFWTYQNEKWYHGQWDDDAKALFRTMLVHGGDVAAFIEDVKVVE